MTVQAGSQDGCRRGAGQSPGIRVSSRSCILSAAYFQCGCDRCFSRQPQSPADGSPELAQTHRSRRQTTKTWERRILRNRPCMALRGRLSGTYCSQVAIRTPIWEPHPFRTDCQSTFLTRTMLPNRLPCSGGSGDPPERNFLFSQNHESREAAESGGSS